jgi:hypothetical protein
MTHNNTDTMLQDIDNEHPQPTTAMTRSWTPPIAPNQPHRTPWWTPLLVPALMTVLFVMGSIGDHGQAKTQHPTLVGDAFAWIFILTTLVAPAFYAGFLYNQQRDTRIPR